MRKLGLNQIREEYLSFFESKDHLRMESFSLVPKNDPSLLLINAGMAPLKNYFMGIESPPRKRVTSCQKCIRTPDIDNVGKTARHGTFFEMLGNFSFGDYFKREAIIWAWEFLTEVMQLPKDRLFVSVYLEDDEAYDIWDKVIEIPKEKILRLGKEDNFWELGTGPSGPCSEIHFDRGEAFSCGEDTCTIGCDCDRYLELWNLVFTQFDKQADGSYVRLPEPNIDTGMGLERLAAVMQGVDNLFEVDTVRRILDTVCSIAKKEYGKDYNNDVSIRVITDHIRSTVMMISDGVIPSNEGRGYVLRRLLRGASRHGRLLGVEKLFLNDLADVVIEESREAYPDLEKNKEYIKKLILAEEERFSKTISQGLTMLDDIIKEKEERKDLSPLDGEVAFKLHDTYGFPLSLTQDILKEKGYEVDTKAFEREMTKQKEKAREAIKNRDSSWQQGKVKELQKYPKTEFLGYEMYKSKAKVLAILTQEESDEVSIITDISPFYAESGGQEGDKGIIKTDSGFVEVYDTVEIDGRYLHIGRVQDGKIEENQEALLEVDEKERKATERNHSSTHLLHKALKQVLGSHVKQAGSSVNDKRLRFDFSHMKAVTKDELRKVEEIVNENIYKGHEVSTQVMSLEEAKASGAEALFDEKYDSDVRVVSMGSFSKELCGGTHVKNSANIGIFKIISEGAVAAGIRRIEAYTGEGAREYLMKSYDNLEEISDNLKTPAKDTVSRTLQLQEANKQLTKEVHELKSIMATSSLDDIVSLASDVGGIKLVKGRFDMLNPNELREQADKIRDKIGSGLVLLVSAFDEKVSIVCLATKDAVQKGVNCGNIVREAAKICGGSGGGRPDMAQAGGKDIGAIDTMLGQVENLVKEAL